jgi:hypothetical protein
MAWECMPHPKHKMSGPLLALLDWEHKWVRDWSSPNLRDLQMMARKGLAGAHSKNAVAPSPSLPRGLIGCRLPHV